MDAYKFAYISRLIYPDAAANALQTIQMAAALARETGEANLFVHDLARPEEQIRQQYAIEETPLRIWSMHTKRWPDSIYFSGARFMTYNSAIAAILGLHPGWWRTKGRRNVLFVRSRLEILYWGLMRPYLPWLRNWIFSCEVHDLQLPLRPGETTVYDDRSPRTQRTVQALKNFDLVLAVTQGLAEDIHSLTQGQVQPQVAPLCTGVPRLRYPPKVRFWPHRIVIGYIGTIDMAHGISDLFQAIERLPENYVLRVVGRVQPEARAWLDRWLSNSARSHRVEWVAAVPYAEVTSEIDRCHLVLAPAGDNIHSQRHRSPLKIFDYMARGKPIVAAQAPCHLELLQDGVNASLYRQGDPGDLAARVKSLVKQPQQAETIARQAWEQSANYTYPARAKQILELIDEIWEQRQARRSITAYPSFGFPGGKANP